MVAILSLLLIVTLSIVVTRVATVALIHTGLSRESARFQARSAFTGAGFTTSESERVVQHPVRRRIVMVLMLLGNAGIVTAMSSLILTFVREEESGSETGLFWKLGLLVVGVAGLWAFATSAWVDRHLSNFIEHMMGRYSALEVKDYTSLMHLAGDYRLAELSVAEGDWLDGKRLGEALLRDEGVVVLGITRPDGGYLGTPGGDTEVHGGDVLLTYARLAALERIEERKAGVAGDVDHEAAADEHEEVKLDEREEDE